MSLGLWRTLTITLLLPYFLFPDFPSIYSASLCPGLLSRKFHDLFVHFGDFLLVVCSLVAVDPQLLVVTLDNTHPIAARYPPLVALYRTAIWIMDCSVFCRPSDGTDGAQSRLLVTTLSLDCMTLFASTPRALNGTSPRGRNR